MRFILLVALISVIQISCDQPRKLSSTDPVDWDERMVTIKASDSLEKGSTFLSIYSQIYMRNDEDQTDLTATVSLHNPNLKDKIFIDKAIYYNTQGKPIRVYFEKTIFIRPMETVQIVIDGIDNEGGTGANFIFNWEIKPGINEPIFEAVMIGSQGRLGLSFVTAGKKLNN